ncbi:MAG: hypothetical protein OCD02_15315 [Spirochaetaceae bacterium]
MDEDIPMSLKMGAKSFKGIEDLAKGNKIDEKQILDICDFIDNRLDCADFRVISILRTLYSYQALLSKETITRMETTILGFKYWMDEPGDDSMCYWSENHQILFFTCGYLAGQLYKKSNFKNSNRSGLEMMEIFKPRIIAWLKQRFEHGFVEWHSNTYYEEDIPPLTLLIDFADDKNIQVKATMILDLFIADMAMHNFKGLFAVTSGRCYEEQKRGPLTQDTLQIAEFLFGQRYSTDFDYSRISANLILCKNYKLPSVIKDIALDEQETVIKTSMGHDLAELKDIRKEKGVETGSYLQWAMESFTNPEIIQNTLKMYRKYNMKSNIFLKDLGMLDMKILGPLLPTISRVLNPMLDGVAIQKVNSYTYKNRDFILSTAQNHYPGTFGDQQHIWQATINEKITIFTTHPGIAAFDDNARSFSPSYWVGNAKMPHSIQHENINMSIYKVDQRKGFMEKERQHFTHAHFPTGEFDKFVIEDNYIFGTVDNVKVALIGKEKLSINPEDPSDILQHGKVTYWICELSNSVETFEEFMLRIKSIDIKFNNLKLSYKDLELTWKGDFKVNNKVIDTNYNRVESIYGNSKRCDQDIEIAFNGKKLLLNFNKNNRVEL